MIVDKVKNPLFLDPSAPCAGCASAVEVDQEIVNFALAELSYGACQMCIKVENFKQQVTVVVLCSGDISIMLLRWWPASSTASTW